MNRPSFFKLLAAAAALLGLSACPNPITGSVLAQITDKSAPAITISSPQDNSQYTQTVTVQGSIAHVPGELREVGFLVAGTLGLLTQGEVPLASIGANGAFSFQFDTVTFNGPIVITLTAQDWNDNQASKTITLNYPGSSVSSFTATPSSKRVDLSWEPVDGATGYTVYYTANGTLPSESYGSTIDLGPMATTVPLTGLKNGALHIFLLRAHMDEPPDYWSGYVRTIPLSPLTLAPLVRGGYREISLEWAQIEATEEFEVLRATSENGPYENYTGVLSGFSFTDTNVSEDTWYYYKVKPSLEGSIVSTFNAAQTFQVPPQAERITSLTLPYAAQKVRIASNYAYVAAGAQGLLVVDITDPAAPVYLRTIGTTNAKDLVIQGSYLYLADGAGGVRVLSLASPDFPVIQSTYTGAPAIADATALALDAMRNHLYVIDGSGNTNLLLLNADNLDNIDDYRTRYPASVLSLLDVEVDYVEAYPNYTFVYVTALNTSTSANELREFYYYNLGASQKLFEYRTFTDPDYNPNLLAVSDDYVYLLATRNADIEPPPEYCLFVVGKYPLNLTEVGQTADTSGYASDLRISGGKAYAADKIGMQVYGVSTPSAPVKSEFLDTPGTPGGIDTDGSYAFLASGLPLFQVVDLRLPGSMSVEGSYSSAGGLKGLAVRGDIVYAAGTAALQLIDIGDPTLPPDAGLGSYTITGAVDVALSGPYAFVAAGVNGLTVVDVSNSGSPAFVGSVAPISSYLERVAIKGDYLYAASGSGLQVYDVSNPAQPVGIGIYDSAGGGMQDVELRGERAYTTDGAYFQPNSLKVLDVSQPAIPASVGSGLGSGMIIGYLSLYGDWAFVSDQGPGLGLWAVNVNPASASYMSAYGPCDTRPGAPDSFGSAGVAAFGAQAYVLEPTAGLVLINVSNPAALSDASLVTSLALGADPQDLILNGRHALATDGASGLRIVKLFP
ncbi:MAG: hypothetical protein A2064_13540 [Spirochaetes bacterium GWB1_66_5]|nr:MAG: hypothetical protein A2064_13540 [Spirochaetes bacterium GWB1_66_5]